MIISRTPFRISFFGGGTDYPGWYKEHGGEVLATSIDKYCYITCRYLPPFFEHTIRLVYSSMENCNSVDEIQHPSVREVLRQFNFKRSIEIHHDADLPARSGIGSSSSFTVGLIHALHALEGRMPTKQQLTSEAIHVEQVRLQETVGSQDQTSAAHGGFNHIIFHRNNDISVHPVLVPTPRVEELNNHLMLFYTGIRRTAASVASSYVEKIEDRRRQMRLMTELTREALSILNSTGSILHFGELLAEAWDIKKSFSSKVSNPDVDELYASSRQAGAIGGKLLGAGGGGFMLLFVEPEKQEAVRKALTSMVHVPFRFDSYGSRIIFMDRQEDFSRLDQEYQVRAFNYRELGDLAFQSN